MPSPTSKGKSNLATKGKLAILGIIALMVLIYFTTFVMQVQACDQAIEAIHTSYEKKLQYLRTAFNKYKNEHPGGRGKRRKGNLDHLVAEMRSSSAEELRKENITVEQFNTLFLEECFRRFGTIPWGSKDFTPQDRKELVELWETIRPETDAEFDRPLPRKKHNQLQRILQRFYVKVTHRGYSHTRYNINAPKFFLHKAVNEIELLQIKPQVTKLQHEWIQSGQTTTNETLRIMTKLISDRGLNNALGSFVSNIHLLIRDPTDLDYYYEYNYYNDEYLLQLNEEAQEIKRLAQAETEVKSKETDEGARPNSVHDSASIEAKRARLVRNIDEATAEAKQKAVNARREYEREKLAASQGFAAHSNGVVERPKGPPRPPPLPAGRGGSKSTGSNAGEIPPGQPLSPPGAKLRGPSKPAVHRHVDT